LQILLLKFDTTSITSIPSSLISDLDKLNLNEERLKRYADEANIPFTADTASDLLRTKAILSREKAVSETLKNIMEVDLCFVLDCTLSMESHITAAKDCII
jgi:hypothetical protein